jgi:chemotaxis protein MotB
MTCSRSVSALLLLAVLPSACVTAGRFQAKEAELAGLRREAADRERAGQAERDVLQRQLELLRAEEVSLGRRLASVSYDRDILREARDNDLFLLTQLRKKLESLGQNVEALVNEKGALASILGDARERLRELDRQKQAADQRALTYQGLVQKLQAMISAGDLDVVIRQGRMLIVMPTDVLFDSGRTVIKPQGRTTLAAVARALTGVRERRFTVVGHTDDVPIHTARFRSNWDLSAARAVEVVLFLVESGLPPGKVAAAGHAEFEPVTANDSSEHRASNRRVEIELEPNLTELPPFAPAGLATAN